MDIVTFVKYFRGRTIQVEIHGHDGVNPVDWEGTNFDIYHLPEDHAFHLLKVDRAAIRYGTLIIFTRTSGQAR